MTNNSIDLRQEPENIMNNKNIHCILAIETSCDETAAAVYSAEHGIESNVLFSQVELHAQYGGVVPEIASRWHINKIIPIIDQALKTANRSFDDIDAIAITNTPGLPGSLLVGLASAKALAYVYKKPLIAVNHLEGHIYSAHIENEIPFPYLCLAASGGHTSLYIVHSFYSYERIAKTVDDAAGEAFDKVAKLLQLGYPGGPIIERLAREEAFSDTRHYPRLKHTTLDFSFSGLKTAVLYDLVKMGCYSMQQKKLTVDHLSENERVELNKTVASSFLACVGDIFAQRVARAIALYPDIQAISFVGGVACNKYLQARIKAVAEKHSIRAVKLSGQYCTDNAAMIAFVAYKKTQAGLFADLSLDI